MTTASCESRDVTARGQPLSTSLSIRNPAGHAARLGAIFLLWRERRRRRRTLAQLLARLDDRLLADIGLSRAEASEEASTPFWR
ncbi:MAG: DUF1127 domain-containing protein [Pseudomonadota bacterium]